MTMSTCLIYSVIYALVVTPLFLCLWCMYVTIPMVEYLLLLPWFAQCWWPANDLSTGLHCSSVHSLEVSSTCVMCPIVWFCLCNPYIAPKYKVFYLETLGSKI